MKRVSVGLLCLGLFLFASALPAEAGDASTRLAALLRDLPAERVPSGILYDRALPLSGIERFDGAPDAPAADLATWRQIGFELRRASLVSPAWTDFAAIEREARAASRAGIVTLAVANLRYERIREDALATGALIARGDRLVPGSGEPFASRRAVVAAALPARSFRGEAVRFRCLDPAALSNLATPPAEQTVDFGDGLGYRPVEAGREEIVRYAAEGTKEIRVRLRYPDGAVHHARTSFLVERLRTPAPHDTIPVTATIPYNGAVGHGEGFVYLAPGHTTLTEPVLVIEGFDYDNTMNWDELYTLLNQQELLETLRAQGFDAVVLNFDDAVDYIQRNSMVAVELIQQIQAAVGPEKTLAVVGASMGGLIGRYALGYMETQALPHRVRTFLSFDSPQNGANIPLGIQYWLWFFADDSADAAAMLASLDTPGARQMLAYHHTDPPGGAGQADPLRAQLLSDYAAIGQYPVQPRLVSIANGSGAGTSQGFGPLAQIIRWEYTSFLVDITGNVWALPDGTNGRIFQGMIDFILLPEDATDVNVAGTLPYDNAPGGWRDSMAQMDATPAPYGDIVALHANHCFIPTVSALALDTGGLFHDVDGDPELLSHTPFDAVYFPTGGENQEHVLVTPEGAAWFLAEVTAGASSSAPDDEAVEGAAGAIAAITGVAPNPVGVSSQIVFTLPRAGRVELALHAVDGRRVAVLATGEHPAGSHGVTWAPRDGPGGRLPAGVYLLRLTGEGFAATRKVLLP